MVGFRLANDIPKNATTTRWWYCDVASVAHQSIKAMDPCRVGLTWQGFLEETYEPIIWPPTRPERLWCLAKNTWLHKC